MTLELSIYLTIIIYRVIAYNILIKNLPIKEDRKLIKKKSIKIIKARNTKRFSSNRLDII